MARKTSRKDVGAWLGGNRGTVQSRMPSVGASSDTEAKADAGGGQMEQVRAELGLGAYAFGVGAAGALAEGVVAVRSGRVVNPVAAARNAARGERVVVSGTPRKIKGASLNPKLGEELDTAVVYSWNPRGPYSKEWLAQNSDAFSRGAGQGFPNTHNAQRNVVVGTVKKSSTFPHHGGMESEAFISTTPINIKAVVKAPVDPLSDAANQKFAKQLEREIRKAGSSLRGTPLADRLDTPALRNLQMAASRQKLKIDKRIKKR